MAQKTIESQFTADWQKAVAWAQSNGINAKAYLPVYQLDANRVANGGYPMSAALRNRAILAAHDPSNVTPAPSDQPRPSNVVNNAKRDLTMIGTGLEPQHLVGGLFDMVKNTVMDIAHPSRAQGHGVEDTVGNWLTSTALSLVPGVADIGNILKGHDLREDPLLSLIDLIPAGGGARLLSGSALGARLAERAGMTSEQLASSSALKVGLNALGNRYVKSIGVKQGAQGVTIGRLSVTEKMADIMKNGRFNTGHAIADAAEEYNTRIQAGDNLYNYLYAPFARAVGALDESQRGIYENALRMNQERGIPLAVIRAEIHDPMVVQALDATTGKAMQFQTDKILASSKDSTPIFTPWDGQTHVYTAGQHQAVVTARDTLVEARAHALFGTDGQGGLQGVERLAAVDTALGKLQPQLEAQLAQAAQQARRFVETPDAIQGNIAAPREHKLGSAIRGSVRPVAIAKKDQARTVLAMVDQYVEAMHNSDADRLAIFGPSLKDRLSRWDAGSVDAAEAGPFLAIRDQIDRITQWAKKRQQISDHIDKEIIGQRDANKVERAQALADLRDRKNQLEGRHVGERATLRQRQRDDLAKIRALRDHQMAQTDQLTTQAIQAIRTRGDAAAVRATPEQLKQIMRDVRLQEYKAKLSNKATKQNMRQDAENQMLKAKAGHAKVKKELDQRHALERNAMAEQAEGRRVLIGRVTQDLRTMADAVHGFTQAVWDHPSDVYRDMVVKLFYDHLMKQDKEMAGRITRETEARFLARTKSDARLQALRSNPRLLAEMVYMNFRDLFNDPNMDPELFQSMSQARDSAVKSAHDELHTLIAQGHRPEYLPAADSFDATKDDMTRSGIHISIGHGIPTLDAARRKAMDMTPQRHEVALGISKGLRQVINRDSTIEFAEEFLSTQVLDDEAVRGAIEQHFAVEGLDTAKGNYMDALSDFARNHLNLVRWDPESRLGFALPRWQKGKTYFMDAGMARALERMSEERYRTGVFDKTNRVFRYSVLGLSPRYTAHVLFGGAFMLAARSTPYMPSMLASAWHGIRTGAFPEEIYRTPAEEGMMNVALRAHAKEAGKTLVGIKAADHIEKIQKVASAVATPLHWMKALADLNYNFTRNVRDMMSAVAYLDGAAKAERYASRHGGLFVDPATGETVQMTRERAMEEGMRHVEAVFGNMHRETPLGRQISRSILPFYGWTKHVLHYALSMPIDHPFRAMVLSELAWHNTNDTPLGLPQRISFLFFFGSPDKNGNATATDLRFLDPFRDIGTYSHLQGWIQGLNPIFMAGASMVDPQASFASNPLYPSLSFDPQYGIQTAGLQGSLISAVKQIVPQSGAVAAAVDAATQNRSLASTNHAAWVKSIFNSLNIPFAPQSVNLQQIAVKDETARFDVAKQAAISAWSSPGMGGTGITDALQGYASVPNPLNPDYEITPQQLQAVYNSALAQYPGSNPADIVLSPPNPPGF